MTALTLATKAMIAQKLLKNPRLCSALLCNLSFQDKLEASIGEFIVSSYIK